MAIELEDEHEVAERVRAWLRNNGATLIGGIAAGIVMIYGWNWWQDSRVERRVTAATQFEALVRAGEAGETETLDALARSLAQEFPETPYAAFAQLHLAESRLRRGELDGARDALLGARDLVGKDSALAALLAIRLARLEIALDQPQAALDRLQGLDKSYDGLAAGLRGDALAKLQRFDDARSAYREALTLLDGGGPNSEIVQRKLADLGDAVAGEPAPDA